MQVPAREILYTTEGTWALLDDENGNNWLLMEKKKYDPMSIPSSVFVYRSLTKRGKQMRNEE